jgi:hypothetical protein
MNDREEEARVHALWILHSAACAKLLRSKGRNWQADAFEAALSELTEIIAGEMGRKRLEAAMNWAAGQASKSGAEYDPIPSRH